MSGQTTPTKDTTTTAPIFTSWEVNRAYIRVLSMHVQWYDVYIKKIRPFSDKIGTRNVMPG